MKVDKELMEHVAKTARLNLSEKEVKEFSKEIKDILEAFSKLKEVDTDNIEPAFRPIDNINVMREDKVEDCLKQEEALRNAKHKKNGYFLAPKTIEK